MFSFDTIEDLNKDKNCAVDSYKVCLSSMGIPAFAGIPSCSILGVGWGGVEKCREVNGGKGGLLTILGLGLGFHFVLALRPSPIQSQICVHVSLHTFFFSSC